MWLSTPPPPPLSPPPPPTVGCGWVKSMMFDTGCSCSGRCWIFPLPHGWTEQSGGVFGSSCPVVFGSGSAEMRPAIRPVEPSDRQPAPFHLCTCRSHCGAAWQRCWGRVLVDTAINGPTEVLPCRCEEVMRGSPKAPSKRLHPGTCAGGTAMAGVPTWWKHGVGGRGWGWGGWHEALGVGSVSLWRRLLASRL